MLRKKKLPSPRGFTEVCPPKIENVCDNCHSELIHRSDDTREIALERLRNYHMFSEPLVDFYSKIGNLTVIDTDGLKPDQIFDKFYQTLPKSERKSA